MEVKLYKRIDLNKSLMELEYLCLENNIPISIISDLKMKGCEEVFFNRDGTVHAFSSKTEFNLIGVVHNHSEYSLAMLEFIRMLSDDVKMDVILELDSILDKISKYGRNSLVKEEFEYLFNYK
jgi:hypothetical protein